VLLSQTKAMTKINQTLTEIQSSQFIINFRNGLTVIKTTGRKTLRNEELHIL